DLLTKAQADLPNWWKGQAADQAAAALGRAAAEAHEFHGSAISAATAIARCATIVAEQQHQMMNVPEAPEPGVTAIIDPPKTPTAALEAARQDAAYQAAREQAVQVVNGIAAQYVETREQLATVGTPLSTGFQATTGSPSLSENLMPLVSAGRAAGGSQPDHASPLIHGAAVPAGPDGTLETETNRIEDAMPRHPYSVTTNHEPLRHRESPRYWNQYTRPASHSLDRKLSDLPSHFYLEVDKRLEARGKQYRDVHKAPAETSQDLQEHAQWPPRRVDKGAKSATSTELSEAAENSNRSYPPDSDRQQNRTSDISKGISGDTQTLAPAAQANRTYSDVAQRELDRGYQRHGSESSEAIAHQMRNSRPSSDYPTRRKIEHAPEHAPARQNTSYLNQPPATISQAGKENSDNQMPIAPLAGTASIRRQGSDRNPRPSYLKEQKSTWLPKDSVAAPPNGILTPEWFDQS
ncbi:MAG TPA: hypothetical protein VGE93_17345, partial [Bryobacteraceae bacterium]